MRKKKVKTNYDKMPDVETNTFFMIVIGLLKDNANLPITPAKLAEFEAKHILYREALKESLTGGGRLAVYEKNMAKKALFRIASAVAHEVNSLADGNEVILLSSGFEMAQDASKPVMPKPFGVEVIYTQFSGKIKIRVRKPKGITTKGIVVAVTLASNSDTNINDWKHYFTSAHSIVIDGLTPGVFYAFSVAYQAAGKTDYFWCTIARKMAI